MADYCLICECGSVDDSHWYRCEKTMEVVCPWCVEDLHDIRQIVKKNG